MMNNKHKLIIKNAILKIGCLLALYFGINTYLSFATDTYSTFHAGFKYAATDMLLRNGRAIIALIYEVQYLSGLPNEVFYYISSFSALIFLGISIYVIQNVLRHYIPNENRRIIISFISIANIYIIEYFMFVEKCGFMLAILFNCLGVYCIEILLRTEKKKYLGFAIFLVSLAVFTYQGTVALFVILSLPFAYRYADSIKRYILNLVYIGVTYGISIVMCMAAVKFLFHSSRVTNIRNLHFMSTIKGILSNLIHTFYILPTGLFYVILFVVIVAAFSFAFIEKKKWGQIINIIIICASSGIFSTATIIQGSGWFGMRVVYPLASIVGVLIINIYVNQIKCVREILSTKKLRIMMLVVRGGVFVLLVSQYFSFNKVYIDKYKLNFADKLRAEYVGQAISEYQENSRNVITKIAVYNDANVADPCYPDLYNNGDLVVSSFNTSWSNINALNYYLDTQFEKVDCDEQYIEYFSNFDWECLSKEQLVFEGDTLHLCIY